MKGIQLVVGLAAYVLWADAALAGVRLGIPMGVQLGSAFPVGSVGVLSVAAVGLIVGIRVARKKRSK